MMNEQIPMPRGKLISICELTLDNRMPSQSTIRRWKAKGAPFWGHKSSVEDLLAWLYSNSMKSSKDAGRQDCDRAPLTVFE